jgi:hypothetical protein
MATDYRRVVIWITLGLPLINYDIALTINSNAFTLFEPSQGSTAIMNALKEFIIEFLKFRDVFLQVFFDQIQNICFRPILRHFFQHVEDIFLKSLNHFIVSLVYKCFKPLYLLKYLLVKNSILCVSIISVFTFILESNLIQQSLVTTLFFHPFKMNNISFRHWHVF